MTSRKSRRVKMEKEQKAQRKLKTRFVVMIISVVIMIFSVVQTYNLALYTFGCEVPQEKLKVYRWVCMLLEGDTVN